MLGPETILLPAGISFVAFNNLSYLIDIYTKKTKATKNIIDGNLYSIFFPRVLAGPIEKYQHASSQLINHKVSLDQFWYGVNRFIRGLAKKVLIANTLSIPVSQIFNTPSDELTTSLVWFGIICYTLQIFFDFSGYTDMAIGIGNMFGFRFVENFNYPYISRSITDFWRRWHMSLTGWLREYVYIPLGGNREGANRTYLNIFIVFLIVGVWHGASWTFIVWGIWFAFFMILERWKLFGALQKLPSAFGHIYTLLVVAIGWVIFRSETLMYAGNYIQTMFSLNTSGKVVQVVDFVNYPIIIALILGVIISIPIQDVLKKANLKNMTTNKVLSQDLGLAVNIIFLVVILLISIMFTVNNAYTPFIYSKF